MDGDGEACAFPGMARHRGEVGLALPRLPRRCRGAARMSGYNEADDQTRDMREAVSGGTRSPYEAAYDIVSPSGKSKRGDRNLRRHAEHAPRTRGDLNLERVGFVTGPSLWKNPDTGEIPGHAAPRFYGDGGRLVKAGLPA